MSSPSNSPIVSPLKKIKKKKKSHCKFPDCFEKFSLIVGECNWCTKFFCLKHRHPEAHICPNLQDCKNAAIQKNYKSVVAEKCFLHKKIKTF